MPRAEHRRRARLDRGDFRLPIDRRYLSGGGGAILAVLVLGLVLNRYAPSPKPQPARRIEDEGPGWAIWQALYIAINLAITWHILDETNRQGWDIGHGIWLVVILGLIALAASNLMRWARAWRAGRDRSRAGR